MIHFRGDRPFRESPSKVLNVSGPLTNHDRPSANESGRTSGLFTRTTFADMGQPTLGVSPLLDSF